MKKIFTLWAMLFFGYISMDAQVVLNEFSAANYGDVTDNYGDYEDWIELYNTESTSFDLSGYHLSDRVTNPTKWAFPDGTTIGANGFLRVWASGRNTNSGSHYHTSFKISQTKESEAIVFSDPSGVLIESHEIEEPNQEGHSTARKIDGTGNWGVSTNPTPNAANSNVQVRYTKTPQFDLAPGYYADEINVVIACADLEASIHYTTNGQDPSSSSPTYSGPINVDETTIIRAIAIHPDSNILPSFTENNTYFIGEDQHTIPVISISGSGIMNLMNGDWGAEPTGTFELFSETQQLLDEAVGEYNKHGNDSWAYGQRGIDYITRDQFGYNHAVQHPIFPTKDREKYQRLILKAAANDNYSFENGAHIRDAYLHHLSQVGDLRLDERSYEPCILYVNGDYWGVYEMREKVDDADFTRYYYDQVEDSIQMIKTWGGTWAEYGGNQALNDWNSLYNFIVSNDMSNQDNYETVKSEFNTGSLIDYMIINTQAVCTDWLNYNTAWWRGLNPYGDKKKWRYLLWDVDASFGHYINYTGIPDDSPEADPCDNESPQIDDPEGHTEMLTSLLENEEFYTDYINRYADLNNSIFSCDFMIGLLDDMLGRIEPEMQRQVDRWGGSMSGWYSRVTELREYILTRCTVIDEGIVDCYEVEGPFDLEVRVDPPMSGRVEVNSITPDVYPWQGSYFGGLDVAVNAKPNDGYEFVQWEIYNQELLPDIYTDPASFSFEVGDTIIAYFEPIHIDLTIMVDAPGMGTVELNDQVLGSYPWTSGALTYGSEVNLSALANAGFVFENWTSSHHDFDPDPTSSDVTFTLTQTDTIVAHFFEPDAPADIVIMVNPPMSGAVDLNGTTLTTYPTTTSFLVGENINLGALANTGYEFGFWTMNNNTPLPDNLSENIGVNLAGSDTIVAHFSPEALQVTILVDPPLSGNVSVDGIELSSYPWTNGFVYNDEIGLEAIASLGYVFESWELVNNTIAPSANNAQGGVILTSSDTIIARFSTQVFNLNVNVEPPLSGDVEVEGSILGTYPYSQDYAGGINLFLNSIAADGYQFDSWTWNTNTSEDETLALIMDEPISVTAYFSLTPATITVVIPDETTGNVLVNGELPDSYPYEVEIPIGDLLNLLAEAADGYVFDHWELNNNTLEDATLEEIALAIQEGDVITAIFVEQPPECALHVPTAFSPNGDNVNDIFKLVNNFCTIDGYQMKIFNRWGELVYSTRDMDYGWDGVNATGMGNYVWVMEYSVLEEGEMVQKMEHGTVFLLR